MYYPLHVLPDNRRRQKKIMIEIRQISDLKTKLISAEIEEYLLKFLKPILNSYQTDCLDNHGCIYFLECRQDTLNYKDLSLSQPLKDIPFEFCEVIAIKNSHGDKKLLHGCYILNNDFAIDIFGYESIFDEETCQAMQDNTIE